LNETERIVRDRTIRSRFNEIERLKRIDRD
jgi:hypothetical protein